MEKRDLGYIAWKDPNAWMETMKGTRWTTHLSKEARYFQLHLKDAAKEANALETTMESFRTANNERNANYNWTAEEGTTRVCIIPQPGGVVQWRWEQEAASSIKPGERIVGDFDIRTDSLIAFTRDYTSGSQAYQLVVQKRKKQLWTYAGAHGLAPDVAILGHHIYVLEAESPLRYTRLVQLDLATGKLRKILYEEFDRRSQLSLVKGEGKCLFLLSDNYGSQRLFHVGVKLQQLSPDGVSFFPIGYAPGFSEPCYLYRKESIESNWTVCGFPLKRWEMPRDIQYKGIEAINLAKRLIICKDHGSHTIISCGMNRPPHILASVLGTFEFNPWARWQGRVGFEAHLTIPGITPTLVTIDTREGLSMIPSTFTDIYGLSPKKGKTRSADGTTVSWIICEPTISTNNNKRLIVTGYGAYGIPTSLSTDRWRPYLEAGYSIGFALIRGGGDSNELWAEEGRREGKLRGVEDFEACILSMRNYLKIPADRTCIYGRSAGGYLVGATIARNPTGSLFRFAYTEVPYVDLLRTTTNPKLPLTEYEYLEFGNPARNIHEFEALLHLSPIDSLGLEGAPGVFVLCRTSNNDVQVYPYESAKWIQTLRGSPSHKKLNSLEKILAFSTGEGHFVYGEKLIRERAEDFLILTAAMGAK